MTARLNPLLKKDVRVFKELDVEGRRWSEKNYPGGYTSYGSLSSLHLQSSVFGELETQLTRQALAYVKKLGLDLQGAGLKMTQCWINEMPAGARHTLHAHPLSVVSGTYYLEMPPGASAIRFEDPRLSRFMARPPQTVRASKKGKRAPDSPGYFSVLASAGDYVLFESWLSHEVPVNASKKPRVSISFNFDWA